MKIVVSSISNDVFGNDINNNIKLVNDFVNKGNMFVFATGKNINRVLKILDNRYINCSYYICNDGACIFDQYLNVIYRKDIEQEDVRLIFNALSDSNIFKDVRIDTSTGFVQDIFRSTNKIVANYINYEAALKVVNAINYKMKNIYAYLTSNYINIIAKDVSKANGLNYLLNFYHLSGNDIYAIVKNENDKSLKDFNSYVISSKKGIFENSAVSFEDALKKIEKL